jgi:predicted ATP-dependent endonuclease of OLD family
MSKERSEARSEKVRQKAEYMHERAVARKNALKSTIIAIHFTKPEDAREYLREASRFHDKAYHLDHKVLKTRPVTWLNNKKAAKKIVKQRARAAEPHGYPPGWLGVGK